MKVKSLLLSMGVAALVLAGVSCDKGADPTTISPPPSDTTGGNGGGSTTITLAPPTFSPDTGIYPKTVSVTIKSPSSSAGATIYYTLNSSKDPVPNTAGTLQYDGTPIMVDRSMTIRAIAVKAGATSSRVAIGSYTITGTVAKPVLSIDTITVMKPIKVAITTATPEAVIRYTVDGADPTEFNSKIYQDSILVEASMKIKAKAFRKDWLTSETDSAMLTMRCASPRFSRPSGIEEVPQLVGVSSTTPGTVIYYTRDGSQPVVSSTGAITHGTRLNDGDSIRIDSTVTLTAIAVRTGWTASSSSTVSYTYQVAKPAFSPDSGVYNFSQSISITSATTGAEVRYTIDGSDPTQSSTLLTSGQTVKIDTITKLKARAFKSGWTASAIESKVYYVVGDTLLVHDFEEGQGISRIGGEWFGFACADCDASPSKGDAIPSNLSAPIGERSGRIHYTLAPTDIVGDDEDSLNGWAGMGTVVPSDLMGRTGNIIFWAKFTPAAGSGRTKIPLVVEAMTSNLDNSNTGYKDVFWRQVVEISTSWKQYIVDISGLYYPEWAILEVADSCGPEGGKVAGRIFPKDTTRIMAMGLPSFSAPGERWEGPVGTTCPVTKWVHDVQRLTWNKGTISGFRWTVLGRQGEGDLFIDHIQLWQQPAKPGTR